MMTSATERHKAEETCIVASRERGHCSKVYGGGQNSAHLLWPIAVEHFARNNAIVFFRCGICNFKSDNKTSCNFLRAMKTCTMNAKSSF